jgi:hypothetical protein
LKKFISLVCLISLWCHSCSFSQRYICWCHYDLQQRQMFPEAAERLHFGTSVFHSYVHNWKCQLEFSPRLNDGLGLSDGEGLERLWSYLSTLVSPLRYSTRSHRLGALQHKVEFHNKKGIVSLSM